MIKENSLILVNRNNPLPIDYCPCLEHIEDGYKLRKDAAVCARKMLCNARKSGIALEIISAYRSSSYQNKLIEKDIKSYMEQGLSADKALEETMKALAAPGTSEHNAGLALDLLDTQDGELTESFDRSTAFMWLTKNAHKYGFILRYPKNKENVTGITYEPWHFRFVGAKDAKKIKNAGITLEEYIEKRR